MSELNIQRLVDDGLLSSIHHAFAEMIQRFDRDAPPSVSLAAFAPTTSRNGSVNSLGPPGPRL